MNVRKYRYFVSYNCNSYAGSGSGWVEVFRDSPISGGQDIKEVTEQIQANGNVRDVTILYFSRFDDPA